MAQVTGDTEIPEYRTQNTEPKPEHRTARGPMAGVGQLDLRRYTITINESIGNELYWLFRGQTGHTVLRMKV
jgi:hypothetical protein